MNWSVEKQEQKGKREEDKDISPAPGGVWWWSSEWDPDAEAVQLYSAKRKISVWLVIWTFKVWGGNLESVSFLETK